MGLEVEVSTTTVAVAIACVAVTAMSELFISRPLFSHRMHLHEHRSSLTTLVLLFVGMGMLPMLYSSGFFVVFLYPGLGPIFDPVLKACEAIALLLFWYVLVALAGGRERAAMCVETSRSGPVCLWMPFCCNYAACRFRSGARALRFWQLSVCQWVVVSPIIRWMANNDSALVRLSALPIEVVGLVLMLRGLLDTHRGTRHAAPRHARPDAQFIVIKIMVFVLLVQTSFYGLAWPPPAGPPDGVTRAFALLTIFEMTAFSLIFAWAFGPHALWWALDQTPLTAALTDVTTAVFDSPAVSRQTSRVAPLSRPASQHAGGYSAVDADGAA